jgi:hypothetical protein
MERHATISQGDMLARTSGALLLAAMAVIDVLVVAAFVPVTTYPGILFLLNAAFAVVLAAGVLRGLRPAWQLGILLTGVTIVAFVAVRTVGLFGLLLNDWLVLLGPLPLGPLSLVVEAAFIVLSAMVVARGRPGHGA